MLIKTIIERLSSIVAVSSLAYLHGFIGWKNVIFLRSVALRQNGWDNRSTLFVSIASLSRSRIDSQSSVATGILRVNLLEKRIRVLCFVHEYGNLRAKAIPALCRDLEESAPATQTSKRKPESLTPTSSVNSNVAVDCPACDCG